MRCDKWEKMDEKQKKKKQIAKTECEKLKERRSERVMKNEAEDDRILKAIGEGGEGKMEGKKGNKNNRKLRRVGRTNCKDENGEK